MKDAMRAEDVVRELKKLVVAEKAAMVQSFFKTGPGEYSEGDRFIGVTVPNQRLVAKKYRELSLEGISQLLDSEWHECRLTGLLILVLQFEKAKEPLRAALVDFYLSKLDCVNNWDLVDSSAPKILGAYSLETPNYRKRIEQLAASGHLWRERVAVLATHPHIKKHDFVLILKLAKKFLGHEHDLMHKAVGWMLREVGKVDESALIDFLDDYSQRMPRTMLRYAIEKFPQAQREFYLGR